jgi:hypothetical protein
MQYDSPLFFVHNVALGFCLTVTYALLMAALVWRVKFVHTTTTISFAQHKMVCPSFGV